MKRSGAKKRGSRLLIEFMEGISWRVMEEYPDVVKKMIQGRGGLYALYRRDKLYYVGLASNLMGRLKSHLRDRHTGVWDRFNVYLTTTDDHMKELESLLLRIVMPRGNRFSGRLAGAEDLKNELNRQMSSRDADKRARLLGGHVAQRRSRNKASRARGSLTLAGLYDRPRLLRAPWRGQVFRATLRRDGYITFRKKRYSSPSKAGAVAIGHGVDGWHFWKFRAPDGKWEKLDALRK